MNERTTAELLLGLTRKYCSNPIEIKKAEQRVKVADWIDRGEAVVVDIRERQAIMDEAMKAEHEKTRWETI